VCNNADNRISTKNYERVIVGRFGNCQRAAGRCKAVVRTLPEFRSGVVGRTPGLFASKPNRVRPLQRRSIQLTFVLVTVVIKVEAQPIASHTKQSERVLAEAVTVTLQRNKVVTRKLSAISKNSRASRPYVFDLFKTRRGVFYYLKFGPSPAYQIKLGVSVSNETINSTIRVINSTTSNSNQLRVRGVRGAISVAENNAEAIYEATATLVRTIFEFNQLEAEDVASIFFTTTRDLDAAFPALAVRRDLGLTDIPMMCSHEMEVRGALPRIVRVMFHVNTTRSAAEIRHVYLREAVALRPDKASS